MKIGFKHTGGMRTKRVQQGRDFAIQCEMEDIEAGNPGQGRPTRVAQRIADHFGCTIRCAHGYRARAEAYLAEKFDKELPLERAKICRQLQAIADKQENADPKAAVAALNTKAKIVGVFAAEKVEVAVTHGTTPQLAQQIDAYLDVLSEAGRAGLELALAEIAAAQRDGRLALPAAVEDDVEDAELVDDLPIKPGEN